MRKLIKRQLARRNANACSVQWVLDQLHGYFLPNSPGRGMTLSRDGRPNVNLPIENLLQGKLEAMADQLNWQFLRTEGDRRFSRTEKVRDVLSAFSTKVLPEDYRQDLVETTTQARTAEQCVVQGDLEATIFRLAVHDDSVFGSLCKAMPAAACAAIYFDKVQEQSRQLLVNFDQYCLTGQLPADPSSGGVMEVDQVVAQLRRSVARISLNVANRTPHGTEGAAKALVSILGSVAQRNRDPLEGNCWNRTSFQNEDEDQRNLYHLLIGSEDMDLDPESELFVLSALEALPMLDLSQFIRKLRDTQRMIEVSRAPRVYLIRLGALVRAAESAGATGAGSGQKRTAAGNSGGNSKRTR